jgi:hypothetical protein
MCRILTSRRLRLSSEPVRAPVYKTAALPTELHRRETRCMVAHPGLDVRILVLTCGVSVASAARWPCRLIVVCPAGIGRKWLAAALCAEYVLKFRTYGRWLSRREPGHGGAVADCQSQRARDIRGSKTGLIWQARWHRRSRDSARSWYQSHRQRLGRGRPRPYGAPNRTHWLRTTSGSAMLL